MRSSVQHPRENGWLGVHRQLHLRVKVSNGVHIMRPEVGLEGGLAVDHEVLTMLVPRAAVIVVNRERRVVVRNDCANIQGIAWENGMSKHNRVT